MFLCAPQTGRKKKTLYKGLTTYFRFPKTKNTTKFVHLLNHFEEACQSFEHQRHAKIQNKIVSQFAKASVKSRGRVDKEGVNDNASVLTGKTFQRYTVKTGSKWDGPSNLGQRVWRNA